VTIRVLVVDDQPVVRAGVATMLGTQPDLAVAGDAANGLAAVAMAARLRPDVVLTVKTHVTRVLAQLGLRDRAHAVIYGYETGLVRPGDTNRPRS
jgi:DNA-binding NarL/FixJ family response regulator